ncbi:MAG: CDP-alcohol phosphatidyltransferase family protein [Bacteroidia bacterium]
MKRHIPNLITLGNLACGCVGISFAHAGNLWGAALLLILAAILDFFDGFSARILKVSGELGAQLDSLADLVTFGVLPAFIAQELFMLAAVDEPWAKMYFINGASSYAQLIFIFTLAGAYRLARFNISGSSKEFIGVPIPAAGLYLSSFALIYRFGFGYPLSPLSDSTIEIYVTSTWVILISAIVMALLMVSKLRLMTLKISSFTFKGNELRIVLILGSALLLIFFGVLAIQLIVLLYLILSIIQNVTAK